MRKMGFKITKNLATWFMDAPFCVKISPLQAIERLIRKNDYRDAALVRLYLDIFSFIKNFAKKIKDISSICHLHFCK